MTNCDRLAMYRAQLSFRDAHPAAAAKRAAGRLRPAFFSLSVLLDQPVRADSADDVEPAAEDEAAALADVVEENLHRTGLSSFLLPPQLGANVLVSQLGKGGADPRLPTAGRDLRCQACAGARAGGRELVNLRLSIQKRHCLQQPKRCRFLASILLVSEFPAE